MDCGHCGFWVIFVSAAVSGVSPGGSERDTQSKVSHSEAQAQEVQAVTRFYEASWKQREASGGCYGSGSITEPEIYRSQLMGWLEGPPAGSGPGVPAVLSEVIILGGRHCRHHRFQPVDVESQRGAHFRDRALGSPLLQL